MAPISVASTRQSHVVAKEAELAASSALERWFATAKRGVLGVLFVMSNDVSEKRWRAWFIVVFHMLQVPCRVGPLAPSPYTRFPSYIIAC